MMLLSGYMARIVQKGKAMSSDETHPEVGANVTVQWRICSLPMELNSGSEFAPDFESSGAET